VKFVNVSSKGRICKKDAKMREKLLEKEKRAIGGGT
jgi:hypothetical protein